MCEIFCILYTAPDKMVIIKLTIFFSYFVIKTYIVGKKPFTDRVLACFHFEIRKLLILFGWKKSILSKAKHISTVRTSQSRFFCVFDQTHGP